MGINLFQDLGFDEESPDVMQAREAARAYAEVIDSLVDSRHEGGVSQREVAKRMGTTQSAVSDLESLTADARFSTVIRYAQAVGCELEIAVIRPDRGDTDEDYSWGQVEVRDGWKVDQRIAVGPKSWDPGNNVTELFASSASSSFANFDVHVNAG